MSLLETQWFNLRFFDVCMLAKKKNANSQMNNMTIASSSFLTDIIRYFLIFQICGNNFYQFVIYGKISHNNISQSIDNIVKSECFQDKTGLIISRI